MEPSPSRTPCAEAGVDASAMELWKKYEDVAMHFNDLLMRWPVRRSVVSLRIHRAA
jgi:hypothetical protein